MKAFPDKQHCKKSCAAMPAALVATTKFRAIYVLLIVALAEMRVAQY
jgi:hypothetical protein